MQTYDSWMLQNCCETFPIDISEQDWDALRDKCVEYFDELCRYLSERYEVVGSCNQDISRYLVPRGTVSEITYHSKPVYSFRISDHWNWYANVNKCKNEHYIQCYSVDLPWAKKRPETGKASKPVRGFQVAYFGEDNKYHAVFGEYFNRKTNRWYWMVSSPRIIAYILNKNILKEE